MRTRAWPVRVLMNVRATTPSTAAPTGAKIGLDGMDPIPDKDDERRESDRRNHGNHEIARLVVDRQAYDRTGETDEGDGVASINASSR